MPVLEGFSWKNKAIRLTILLIAMLELISFFGWLLPVLGNAAMVAILGVVLVASLRDLRMGVAVMAAELMIGSHGYLFSFQHEGLSVSVRIGLFLVVCSVALVKALREHSLTVWQSFVRKPLIALAAVLVYAVLRGLQNGNGFSNVFFDTNAFLYFGAALPFWQAVRSRQDLLFVLKVAFAAAMASVGKVLLLVYMFSHKLWWALPETYRWVRDTRIGELTQMTETIFRIFLQSQIYTVIVFFAVLAVAAGAFYKSPWKDIFMQKRGKAFVAVLTMAMASILISLSRSNWVGMVMACLSLPVMLYALKHAVWRPTVFAAVLTIVSSVFAIILLAAVVLVPFPPANGSFSASLFGSRALTFTKEAGIGSRWALLPPLWAAIAEHPILGQGFGKEVTYKTQDPRLLAQNPTGEYTTFIFEWGYHDLWLKLGLFGVVAYGYYCAIVLKRAYTYLRAARNATDWEYLLLGLTLGLVALLTTHITSPYINHPLGIGFLLFYALFVDVLSRQETTQPR